MESRFTIIETQAIDQKIEELSNKYVPGEGKAATVGGEIVRALERVMYRWWNDGDQVGVGYGNITCNGSFRYLRNNVPYIKDLNGVDELEYEDELYACAKEVMDYLEKHPEVFEIENQEDSRVTTREDRDAANEYEAEDSDYMW